MVLSTAMPHPRSKLQLRVGDGMRIPELCITRDVNGAKMKRYFQRAVRIEMQEHKHGENVWEELGRTVT